ncbi:S4 domain-containing protein YaaA [Clostridium thermarum]|uniref:S4 domain-containing protein YaaA n=1 Tax=Clostridium thermarum TaxID=1716543 RepID=UPI0011204A31|nr:S4 domain-containing protein YaaA [Clostridium thermarum]
MKEIKIETEYIKLDSFLKWCGEFAQGSDAKMFILAGNVKVNGEVELRRGRKLRNGDIVEFGNEIFKIT